MPSWLQYRQRLLEAGLGHRWVTRHVRELQDHFDDLRLQAQRLGHDAVTADAHADNQLGALSELAATVIASTRPILLHRRPLLMATLLPSLAYLSSCIVMTLLVYGAGLQLRAVLGATWLDLLMQFGVEMQAYVVLPLLGMMTALYCIRNHCRRRYWVAGLLVLCLSGSAVSIAVVLPDPARHQRGAVGVRMFYALHQSSRFGDGSTNWLRLLVNLLLTGAVVRYSYRRERQAMPEHGRAA